ncbi:MAG: cytochrome b [Steroidobacter sp.]
MAAAIPASASMNETRYTGTAVSLHWLIAALIICAFTLGWIMTDLEVSPLKLRMFNWHKWVGVTILLLAIIRLLWRLAHKPPAMLPMPAWQRIAAKTLHAVLYVLLLLQPLLGWFYSNAVDYRVVYLGILPLPNLVDKDKHLADIFKSLHQAGAWCLLVVVSLHILAALKHHFVDGDATLKRMWFR